MFRKSKRINDDVTHRTDIKANNIVRFNKKFLFLIRSVFICMEQGSYLLETVNVCGCTYSVGILCYYPIAKQNRRNTD